jgi:hypothetical protein
MTIIDLSSRATNATRFPLRSAVASGPRRRPFSGGRAGVVPGVEIVHAGMA